MKTQRKIIHVDMDCFYAAIEIRDNPVLKNKPVAVGGPASERSVLCTCNYVARQYGVRSAMATAYALRLCPDLIVLPVNMEKYKKAAILIRDVFREYTDLIEPLSLDEAYLDVSDSTHCQGSATWIAQEIKNKIVEKIGITASAGVAPNKFLAKIASGWKKPDGLFVIAPHEIEAFVKTLPVDRLFGVGKVTSEKLHQLGLNTCSDLLSLSLSQLTEQFGKFGKQLYDQCRGIDEREVEPNRIRKSLSVEHTFSHDIHSKEACFDALTELHARLLKRLENVDSSYVIKNQYIKVKFNDFKVSTLERMSREADFFQYQSLLGEILLKDSRPIRLLGVGVHFSYEDEEKRPFQQLLIG